MLYSEHLKEGKANREKFLAPYKNDFDEAETEKQKAEIIIKLLKKKASLLSEPWVLFEVIKWMRNRKFKDFLQSAFIEEKGREYRPTERKKIDVVRDFYLIQEIERLKDEYGSIIKACAQLAMLQDDPDTYNECYPKRSEKGTGEGFENFLYKKYYDSKKVWNGQKFEFFYGENIYEIDGKVYINLGS